MKWAKFCLWLLQRPASAKDVHDLRLCMTVMHLGMHIFATKDPLHRPTVDPKHFVIAEPHSRPLYRHIDGAAQGDSQP